MIHVSNSPPSLAGEAGRSLNFSIGLCLPRDVPSYPACEPAALGCSACAASNTAASPTSVRWLLSPPPCRDGTSTADSPAVILRHSAQLSAPPPPAKTSPSSYLAYEWLRVVADLRCYSLGDLARDSSPPVC